eukprot:RCo027527
MASFYLFQFAVNLFLLINAVVHIVAVFSPRIAVASYRRALMAALVSYGVSLYRANRQRMQPTLQAFRQLMLTTDAQYFMYALVMLGMGYVNVFVLGPLVIYATYNVAVAVDKGFKPKLPVLRRLDPALKWLYSRSEPAQLYAALLEVMFGVILVLNVITGQCSVFVLMMHWNFLSYRYQTAVPTQIVFGQLRVMLDQAFHHRRCPRPLGGLWDKLVGFLRMMGSR